MPTSTPHEHEESAPDPEEVAARRVGEVFAGKWRIERILGSGGMATVYAATHTNNERSVALKVLHAELTVSGDMKKRFLREGFIANRVGHPGAVAILDDGVDDDGNVFLVMELLVGASIAERIRAARAKVPAGQPPRPFDPLEALRVADGILDVLTAAHVQGILHRDLKPDNVFLTEGGEVKVLDFGIARLREPQSGDDRKSTTNEASANTHTRTGVVLGTPQYMPPEQARGRTSLVDERSDLWAVGAIVFAMLTGRHVHLAETPNEALLKAMTATAQPVGTLLPGIDPRVAAIVDRALSFDPALRYPDARAMQADVRAAMEVVAPGSVALVPVSGGGANGSDATVNVNGAHAGAKAVAVTSVTRSAMPIVRDASGGRSSGLRVLTVITAIVVAALGGRALLVSVAPHLLAVPEGAPSGSSAVGVASVPARGAGHATVGPVAGGAGAGSATNLALRADAAAAAPSEVPAALAAPPPADAGLDASADAGEMTDAEADEEDDDGGEDEEDSVEAPLPPGAHATHATATPGHRPAAPAHKADRGKKRRKKRKKR